MQIKEYKSQMVLRNDFTSYFVIRLNFFLGFNYAFGILFNFVRLFLHLTGICSTLNRNFDFSYNLKVAEIDFVHHGKWKYDETYST